MKAKIVIGIEIILVIVLLVILVVYGQVLISKMHLPFTESPLSPEQQTNVPTQAPGNTEGDAHRTSVAEKYELLKQMDTATKTTATEKREILESDNNSNTKKLSPEEKLQLLKAQ
jgi:hypothetical protein